MKTTSCADGLVTLAAVCFSVPTFAQISAREYTLDIEQKNLSDALIEFSKQTGLQIAYFPEDLKKQIFVGPLSGRYTAEEAINQLLMPSGSSFERVNERTIAVMGPELIRTQRSLHTTEREDGPPLSSSFMRVANVRWAEQPVTEGDVQGSGRAAHVRADGKKSLVLEEIFVTAQKREERLQDVPISISVLGGVDLDRSTIRDLTEELGRVPGVSFSPVFAGGTSMVAVRGVAVQDSLFHGAATTAYYLDTVPFGFVKAALAPDPGAYDLERVEVLRGPQGTLYGASALNGVVRVLTKDANLNEFGLKARGSTSSTEDGSDLNYRGDMALNVPIIEGKLAARAVLGYQSWSGWIDRAGRKDANDSENRNMRLKLNAQPTEQLSIGLSTWSSRDDSDQPSTGQESGRNSNPFDEPSSTDYDVYALKVGYEFPWLSLVSSTSYMDYAHHSHLDLSPFNFPAIDELRFDAETFAQEVLLTSIGEESWRWSLGSMYRDSKDRIGEFFPGGEEPAPALERNASKSYAVFGELTRLFFDGQWELTAGLRYFEDDVTQTEESRFNGAPPEQLVAKAATFSDTTKRFVLAWHPTEQATLYASYAEGFRSGAHQTSSIILATEGNFPSVEPDRLKNYEVGAKGGFLDGRVNFDTAIYFIDWQNPHRSLGVLVDIGGALLPFAGIVNSVSGSGFGVDAGLTIRPVDALELGANFSWNDLAYDEDEELIPGSVAGQKGDRFPFAPEYTAGATANYLFPLARFEGRFSLSANYTSEKTGQCAAGFPCLESDDILIARASASIGAPDHWTVTFFADNLNNEDGVPVRNIRPPLNVRVRPRTLGLQFEYEF